MELCSKEVPTHLEREDLFAASSLFSWADIVGHQLNKKMMVFYLIREDCLHEVYIRWLEVLLLFVVKPVFDMICMQANRPYL